MKAANTLTQTDESNPNDVSPQRRSSLTFKHAKITQSESTILAETKIPCEENGKTNKDESNALQRVQRDPTTVDLITYMANADENIHQIHHSSFTATKGQQALKTKIRSKVDVLSLGDVNDDKV